MTAYPALASRFNSDYRSTLQSVASRYLARHAHEHLHDEQLFRRACAHLQSLQVPLYLAQRLVHLAMTQASTPPHTAPPGVG
ncbi:hypothetical protein [Pseudomonas sp. 5P_3.1_Bac2]|uniref:hypothetical protein n=1 Tax=Pseudomonas sp. 5P_3.1_Bac2 TaxID=2971617 RepID=UPI0021C8018A|nr:hypothetical protein [Pseudomonas sp. 5P_3.1_Bac2]MCU1718686.1 hypothetical protein [Pseudomonas sp. 5P_3.1_Bac2]